MRERSGQILRIVTTAKLADGMHGKGGNADIDSVYSQFRGDDRPNRTAASHVTAHHKTLHRHTCFRTDAAEQGSRFTVRGITLIGVELDDRPGIEQGSMFAVVFVGKVGMYAVGIVGRNKEGALQQSLERFVACAEQFVRNPLQRSLQERA